MENRSLINKYAMRFGTYMGIFWIVKFALFPLGFIIPLLEFLFFILTVMVPFVGYYFTRSYRDSACGGGISFSHAWIFTTFLYMFTAMFTAVGHYIYFRFIDNGFIFNSSMEILQSFGKAQIPKTGDIIKQIEEGINMFNTLSPIQFTMQKLSDNVMIGAILALPTAFFVKKRVSVPVENNQEDNNQEENKE